MSIMILGAGGAVGAAIARYAVAQGHETHGVLRSVTSRWLLPGPDEGFRWKPKLSLKEGIEATWAWARSRAGGAYLLEDGANP